MILAASAARSSLVSRRVRDGTHKGLTSSTGASGARSSGGSELDEEEEGGSVDSGLAGEGEREGEREGEESLKAFLLE